MLASINSECNKLKDLYTKYVIYIFLQPSGDLVQMVHQSAEVCPAHYPAATEATVPLDLSGICTVARIADAGLDDCQPGYSGIIPVDANRSQVQTN